MSDTEIVKGNASVNERRIAAKVYNVSELRGMLRMIGTKCDNKCKKNKLINLIIESGMDIPIKHSTSKKRINTLVATDNNNNENTAIESDDDGSERERESESENDREVEQEHKYNRKKSKDIENKKHINNNKLDVDLRSMIVDILHEQLPTLIQSTNSGKSVQSISNIPIAPDTDHDADAAIRTHIDMTRSILRTPAKSNNSVRVNSNMHSTQVYNNSVSAVNKIKSKKGDKMKDRNRGSVLDKLVGVAQMGELDNKVSHINNIRNNGNRVGSIGKGIGVVYNDIDGDGDNDGYEDGSSNNNNNNANVNESENENEMREIVGDASASLHNTRLAPTVIKNCISTYGSVHTWIEKQKWYDKRIYHEVDTIGAAIDAFLEIGINMEELGMEILARRLLALNLVKDTGRWELATALDLKNNTLLNHQQLQLIDKVANIFKKFQPNPTRNNSNYHNSTSTSQRGKFDGAHGGAGRNGGSNKNGYKNSNNKTQKADGAATANRAGANENSTAQSN